MARLPSGLIMSRESFWRGVVLHLYYRVGAATDHPGGGKSRALWAGVWRASGCVREREIVLPRRARAGTIAGRHRGPLMSDETLSDPVLGTLRRIGSAEWVGRVWFTPKHEVEVVFARWSGRVGDERQ